MCCMKHIIKTLKAALWFENCQQQSKEHMNCSETWKYSGFGLYMSYTGVHVVDTSYSYWDHLLPSLLEETSSCSKTSLWTGSMSVLNDRNSFKLPACKHHHFTWSTVLWSWFTVFYCHWNNLWVIQNIQYLHTHAPTQTLMKNEYSMSTSFFYNLGLIYTRRSLTAVLMIN